MRKSTFYITIIMPAYNAAKTIESSVRSVLRQSFIDYELIVVDDHSTDGTLDVISALIASESPEVRDRIRVVSNDTNMGVSYSRNHGVELARYDWIAFLDSDDLWTEDKLEKQVELIRQHDDADIIFTGSAFIDECDRRSGYILGVPVEIGFKELLKQNLISCSSVLVRKELLIANKMRYDEMHEDFLLWLTLLKEGCKAYGIDEPLLIYRLSSGSKSADKKKAALMTFRVYRKMGLSLVASLYYFMIYSVRNLKKYRSIRKGFEV